MKIFTRIVFVLLAFIVVSCKAGIKKDLEEFIGREVVLPKEMAAFVNGRDTSLTIEGDRLKLIVWYDSTGCSSCRLKDLWQWEDYAEYADSADFDLCVILSPSEANIHSVNLAVRSQRVQFAVYKDYDRRFYALNPGMPSNSMLHTFLLDRDNKVVIAGNPINNPALAEFYRSVIKSRATDGTARP